MSVDIPLTTVRALAFALVPLLSEIPANAEPLPRIDIAAYCHSIQAINVLPGNAEQKYEGCLASQQKLLSDLEHEWGSMSEEEQRRCVRQEASDKSYNGLAWCGWDTMRLRAPGEVQRGTR